MPGHCLGVVCQTLPVLRCLRHTLLTLPKTEPIPLAIASLIFSLNDCGSSLPMVPSRFCTRTAVNEVRGRGPSYNEGISSETSDCRSLTSSLDPSRRRLRWTKAMSPRLRARNNGFLPKRNPNSGRICKVATPRVQSG